MRILTQLLGSSHCVSNEFRSVLFCDHVGVKLHETRYFKTNDEFTVHEVLVLMRVAAERFDGTDGTKIPKRP